MRVQPLHNLLKILWLRVIAAGNQHINAFKGNVQDRCQARGLSLQLVVEVIHVVKLDCCGLDQPLIQTNRLQQVPDSPYGTHAAFSQHNTDELRLVVDGHNSCALPTN